MILFSNLLIFLFLCFIGSLFLFYFSEFLEHFDFKVSIYSAEKLLLDIFLKRKKFTLDWNIDYNKNESFSELYNVFRFRENCLKNLDIDLMEINPKNAFSELKMNIDEYYFGHSRYNNKIKRDNYLIPYNFNLGENYEKRRYPISKPYNFFQRAIYSRESV